MSNQRARYNWKKSEPVYELFKIIYKKPGITLSELTNHTHKAKSTITEMLQAMDEIKILERQGTNRNMQYSIDRKQLFNIIKIKEKFFDENYQLARNFNTILDYLGKDFLQWEIIEIKYDDYKELSKLVQAEGTKKLKKKFFEVDEKSDKSFGEL